MHTITIDCSDIRSPDDFWQRYVDEAKPLAADQFGRNLDAFWDAFWDAIEHGDAPGDPGVVTLLFTHTDALAPLLTHGGASFLAAIRKIAVSSTRIEVRLT